MTTQKQVVAFGRDQDLMATRLLVLETAGFQGKGVFFLADLIRVLDSKTIGLIMLCHSISDAELHSSLSTISKIMPDIPVLRLCKYQRDEPIGNETVVSALDGPYKLLDVATRLLATPRGSANLWPAV